MGIWVVGRDVRHNHDKSTDDDVKSNNMTYTYTGSDFWSQIGSN